jgi:molecular chaperone DnaK
LGGDDFDQVIISYIADEFKKEHSVDLRKDPQALQRLREAAEKAKIELTSAQEAQINQPFITQGKEGPLHLTMTLTRAKLEQLVDDLVQKTLKPTEIALKDAGIKASDVDEIVMVGGMSRMPKIVETVRKFFGKEPNKSVNPDEVVAVGAAIQGGVLGGEVKDIVLVDVTPLTLGIETLGGVSTPLISKNTAIPTSKSQVFSTAADNQTQVEINVLQGERPMAMDNKSLGRFILDGIPPAPRGIPQVEVSFDIDTNGILNVKAKDKATGKEQNIKITGSTGLSKDEVEKMTKEAEMHAKEDEEKKEKIEVRNTADSLIFTSEKSLREAGDKVNADIKKEVEEKISALKSILDTGTKEDIEAKTKDLSDSLQKVGQAMYASQSQQQPGQGQTAGNNQSTADGQTKTDDKKSDDKDEPVEGEVVN